MEAAAIDEMYALEGDHWWFVGKRLLAASLLDEVMGARPRRILDVGCGTGGVLGHLKDRAEAVVGAERSLAALGYCRSRGLRAVVCADGDRLPFAARSFDVVLLLDVLEHFRDEAALLGGVQRVLRPGGALLV